MSTFVGDALGLPVECKSPTEIQGLFGYVDGYQSNQYSPFKKVARRTAGTISDDSQLTLALMNSFRRKGQVDLDDIKLAHVQALDGKWGEPVGWGSSTRRATLALKNGCYIPPGPGIGSGNGTCMKISPLAILYAHKGQKSAQGRFTNKLNISLLNACRQISQITHGEPMCIVAAYCQTKMIIRALQDEIQPDTNWLVDRFIEDSTYAEEHLDVQWTETDEKELLLSSRMLNVLHQDAFDYDTSLISVQICTANSSYVYNSYPLVAFCVCKYLPWRHLKYAVTETVNAGADADSNGSMVGAIMGAWLGIQAIPHDLISGLQKSRMLIQEIEKFISAL